MTTMNMSTFDVLKTYRLKYVCNIPEYKEVSKSIMYDGELNLYYVIYETIYQGTSKEQKICTKITPCISSKIDISVIENSKEYKDANCISVNLIKYKQKIKHTIELQSVQSTYLVDYEDGKIERKELERKEDFSPLTIFIDLKNINCISLAYFKGFFEEEYLINSFIGRKYIFITHDNKYMSWHEFVEYLTFNDEYYFNWEDM